MKSYFYFVVANGCEFLVSKEKFMDELRTNKYLDKDGNCKVECSASYDLASGLMLTQYRLKVHF